MSRRRIVSAAIIFAIALGGAALAFSLTKAKESVSFASCLDDAGDVVEVQFTADLRRSLQGENVGSVTVPGDAPHLDLRAIELETTDHELLVRIVMAAEWRRSSFPGLGAPPFGTGTLAQVTMRGASGEDYLLQLDVESGGQLSRRGMNGVPETILEGLDIGHEGPVVEGHVPLEQLDALGTEFDWWGFTNGATDLGPSSQQGRTQQDECGTEAAPIAFPGEPIDEEGLASGSASTGTSPGTSSDTAGCSRPQDVPDSECRLTASLSSAITQGLAAEVFGTFGFAFDFDAHRRMTRCTFGEPALPGTEFTCTIMLPDGRSTMSRATVSEDLYYELHDVTFTDQLGLVLQPNGLHAVMFNENISAVQRVLDDTFGQTYETTYSPGSCPGDVSQLIAYEHGLLTFFDSSDRFVGYRYTYSGGVEGLGAFVTAEDIGIGSTIESLRASYRERLRATQIGELWEFYVDRDDPGALTFISLGGDPDDRIQEIRAGADCTLR
jgi:hypothetical protein